jgi:hypothetical protein
MFASTARTGKEERLIMAFCTIVEWDTDVDFSRFAETVESSARNQLPAGCLSRIVGTVGTGSCVIEVWESGEDARRFSEESAPQVGASELPPPTRVDGFEATVYRTR